jgi:hypothetical protein
VLPAAAGRDMASFRRKVKRAVLKADPRTAQDQHADALAQRRVSGTPAEHGMGTLFAYLPADGQQALLTALDLKADQCDPDDPRTKDQRRADALVQLAIDALNGHTSCPECTAANEHGGTPSLPRWRGMRPSVQVTVALSTLRGLMNRPASWRAMDPSLPTWPSDSPPTPTRPGGNGGPPANEGVAGGGWSPTTSATSSTTAVRRTAHRPTLPNTSSPATRLPRKREVPPATEADPAPPEKADALPENPPF